MHKNMCYSSVLVLKGSYHCCTCFLSFWPREEKHNCGESVETNTGHVNMRVPMSGDKGNPTGQKQTV